MKFKIKKGDTVVVTSGKHKGKIGTVQKILTSNGRVIVEKVNMVKRHVKATSERPGSIVEKEAPIHISNVALWNSDESRSVKIGWRFEDGQKVRFDKKTNANIV